ncbi:MAG: CCA tRNA nucleotidyltransferase [Thermoproteota archaeon]|nr:MAG: CCA tRNA nucleotidyltransferase [Candidatus Korarchaeota archaeon]
MLPSNDSIEDVIEKALRLVTPSEEEREELRSVLEQSLSRVESAVNDLNLDAEVVPVGSAVRDTWLPGNNELDIFVLFPKQVGDKLVLGELIREIASKAFGENFEQNYAEHPYVIVKMGDFEIDLVPAYKIRPGERILSAVDRTPLHTKYVKSKLGDGVTSEVRLLKAFIKSIGAYGAEIKTEGFSGYLCELLVIYYGNFLEVIRNAASWTPPVYIDIEGTQIREMALRLFENSPLVVIDPIDPLRNVAAALSQTQFNRFKAASRAFLKSPDIEFFKRGVVGIKAEKVKLPSVIDELNSRGTHLVVLGFEGLEGLGKEVLWSQAKRAARVIHEELEKHGFSPIWSSGWTDESSTVFIATEIHYSRIPMLEKKVGPPVGHKEESSFLKKYLGSDELLGGPYIEGERWFVYRKRRFNEVSLLISELVKRNRLPTYLRGRTFKLITENEMSLLPQWVLNEIWREIKKEEFFVKYLAENSEE